MNDRIYIEQMITGSFVKYNKLSELIMSSYAGSNCEEINLFIDVNSALKQMYSVDAWSYKHNSRYEIAATLINMCGHYREFFRSIGVVTNIYMIYGLNCPQSNNVYVSNYNNKFVQAYMKKPDVTELITENLQILEVLTQFLPKIYFFNIGTCEVSSMVDYIITSTNTLSRGVENIVISKDVLMLQLIPRYNVRVIRPLKTKDGDQSFIIDNTNLYTHFITDYRKSKIPDTTVSNTFFQNILAMTRVPERSIPSIFGIPKVFHFLNVASAQGFLDPSKLYDQALLNTALSVMDIPHNSTELEMRFKAINSYYQSSYVLTLENPGLKRLRLIDLEDVKSLKEIVSKYFNDIPIDLDRL